MSINKRIKKAAEFIRIKAFQPFFRKMSGWDEMQKQIDTLNYIVNKSIDIRSFPKATGTLRQTQLADTELLRIFHEFCQKNGLRYWLDYGTLLGCVRHKGFIPWDDDMDVVMPRADYEKACEILPAELKKYGFDSMVTRSRAWVNYWNGGVMIDIFPMDCVSAEQYDDREKLRTNIHKYRKYYNKHRNAPVEKRLAKWEKLIGKSDLENPIWHHDPEFNPAGSSYSNETIFPLRTMDFEEYQFYVPNDCDDYLTRIYGDYMSFPHSGVLHHTAGGGGMHNNCIKYGVDMEKLIEEYKKIHL